MGTVSGLMWLSGAGVGSVCWLLPGSPHHHPGLFWGFVALTVVYAGGCATGVIPWHRASLRALAVAAVSLQPVVVIALWLSGGQDSYMGPMLVLPMLYVAYFFPPRYAWFLGAIEVGSYASPLVTSPGGHHLLAARTLSYAVAYVGLCATIQFLKARLVEAERHQRAMAHQDPLTGLANRRAFEQALAAVLAGAAGDRGDARRAGDAAPRFALPLADVDWFKQVNDRFGHTIGDRVLRELAAHASAEVRDSDCLARIGGDEFALVACRAGREVADRLAEAVRAAGARVDAGDGPVSLTVSAAVFPEDGSDRLGLMRRLDRDLHAMKDAR